MIGDLIRFRSSSSPVFDFIFPDQRSLPNEQLLRDPLDLLAFSRKNPPHQRSNSRKRGVSVSTFANRL